MGGRVREGLGGELEEDGGRVREGWGGELEEDGAES